MEQPGAGYFRCGLPYNRLGHGPRSLVIFQGLMFENKPQSRLAAWGYDFLAQDYTVYIVLRKPRLPAGYTLADMAGDYATMIREEFGGPVDVLGVSTGASIALHFAADHPELVRRLVIHSGAYTLSEPARQAQRETAQLAQAGRWRAAWVRLLGFMLPPGPVFGLLTRFSALLLSLDRPKSAVDLAVTVEAEGRFNFRDRLAEITAPTLVVAGEQDPFYTPALFQETAAGIPNARLILYARMRHPAGGKQFARDVSAFLREQHNRTEHRP